MKHALYIYLSDMTSSFKNIIAYLSEFGNEGISIAVTFLCECI